MLEPRALPVELKAQVGVLSVADLWLSCFALGTMRSPLELEGLLRGTLRPTRHEYNLIAVALNEYLSDIGVSQLVPYVETMAISQSSWHEPAAITASLSRCAQ
jgi:hypothetical protein